jgi:hypothetical protein
VTGDSLRGYSGPSRHRQASQPCQREILLLGIRYVIGAFQLDPNRKVITLFFITKTGSTSVPSAIKATDKLHNRAIPLYQGVR